MEYQSRDTLPALFNTIARAGEVQGLTLRFCEGGLYKEITRTIFVDKNWPRLTKMTLEGMEFDLTDLLSIAEAHSPSLRELQLGCIGITHGTLDEITEGFAGDLALRGIFLLCFKEQSIRRDSKFACYPGPDGCMHHSLENTAFRGGSNSLAGREGFLECHERGIVFR